jgi:hypothetical protein
MPELSGKRMRMEAKAEHSITFNGPFTIETNGVLNSVKKRNICSEKGLAVRKKKPILIK